MLEPKSTQWPTALRRYLAASLALHLVWEVVQLPLYTIWKEPAATQAFAVLHCTIGDLMIAGLSLLGALAWVGHPHWPSLGTRRIWALLVFSGVAYTVYSEWMNVNVRQTWTYASTMPVLPGLGTGLSPLLQWIIVPTIVLRIVQKRWPWVHHST